MYEELAQLIGQNMVEIAEIAYKLTVARDLQAFLQLTDTPFSNLVSPFLIEINAYLRSNDFEKLRAYFDRVISFNSGRGVPYSDIIQMGSVILQAIGMLVDLKLEGESNARLRATYHRRLESINMLGSVTTNTTAIKIQQKKPEN